MENGKPVRYLILGLILVIVPAYALFAMLQLEDAWVIGDMTRTVLVAPMGAQYIVNADGTLVNVMSAVTERSATLAGLHDRVLAMRFP